MNRIDWDAYMDGTMPQAEREAIDSNEALHIERDGFLAFRKALRAESIGQQVPIDLLRDRLSQVAGKRVSNSPRWVLRTAPLLVGLSALAWWMNADHQTVEAKPTDTLSFAQSAVEDELVTTDSPKAAAWLAGRLDIAAPVVAMRDYGHLVKAQAGFGWGSYVFKSDGQDVHLQISRGDRFDTANTLLVSGRTFYQGKQGLGWRDKGLSFYVDGCGPAILQSSACRLFDEVKTAKRVGRSKRRTPGQARSVKPI